MRGRTSRTPARGFGRTGVFLAQLIARGDDSAAGLIARSASGSNVCAAAVRARSLVIGQVTPGLVARGRGEVSGWPHFQSDPGRTQGKVCTGMLSMQRCACLCLHVNGSSRRHWHARPTNRQEAAVFPSHTRHAYVRSSLRCQLIVILSISLQGRQQSNGPVA